MRYTRYVYFYLLECRPASVSTGGGAASLAVIVASLALGKSALESVAYAFMVLTVETGACLTRFPDMKRGLPIFWMALSVLCIPIFLGKI